MENRNGRGRDFGGRTGSFGGNKEPKFLPGNRADALRELCNTPQHKHKVEEEKRYFLLYLNYAVDNLQQLAGSACLPPTLFKEAAVRANLEKADDATIHKLANFLWLFNVEEPERDFRDYRKLTIMLVTRIYALRNLFAHPDTGDSAPLLADNDLYVLLEGIFKSAANDDAMSEGVRMDKLYKLKLLNRHTKLNPSDPGYPKNSAYEFTRKGMIFLTCLALYKDQAHEFCQLFVDMRLPVRCPRADAECAEAPCNATEKTCNAAKAKALITMFTCFSCRRGRATLNAQTQDYMCFADIVAYLNKVPAAMYDCSETAEASPLAPELAKMAELAANSTESEKNKATKYELHKRFRERFVSFAAGYCEDFGILKPLRFKRLDISEKFGRKRCCFGPERDAELQVRMNRHYMIARDAIGFEYLPREHYGDLKIGAIRGTLSENELKQLIFLRLKGGCDIDGAVETYFAAYHRVLERMLNLPEGSEFRFKDFQDDLCTVAGVTPERLLEDPWEVLRPYFSGNVLRYFFDDDMQLSQEELHEHLCYRLQVMVAQSGDFLTRLKCFNAWRDEDKETRGKFPPDCLPGEINYSQHNSRIQDSELIRWVFNYINLFLAPEEKFRQLPRGEQHHEGMRDHEYQMIHAAIGKYSLDQKGFPELLNKLRPNCPLTVKEGQSVRFDGPFALALGALKKAGQQLLRENPRYDANGRPVRFAPTLFMLAEAAAACYREFCRSELRVWRKRDAYSVEMGELRERARRFGVRPGMPLDRESLIKTILRLDPGKWSFAYDYASGKPYGGRDLASAEHVVSQISLPSGFGQRLAGSLRTNRNFRDFFREDGRLDFSRAFRARLGHPVALRDFYDASPLVARMHAIAAAGGKTADKSQLDKAARAISKSECQDLLLREIAFQYRDRAFREEQALPYKVTHDKGGTVYEYFGTPDSMKFGEITVRFLPNAVTRPSFSTVMNKDTVRTLIAARGLTGTEFDFFDLMPELRELQASDRNKRLEILPLLMKFQDRAERGAALSYEGKSKEERRAMEYACYARTYRGLTEAEYAQIVEMRNQVLHNGLALDTAPVLKLIRSYLLR